MSRWTLLPLRLFLGVTFTYAALDKLSDPRFFDPHSPKSIVAQDRALEHGNPIGGLLRLAHGYERQTGLLIALAELAVGIGLTTGLLTRAAAGLGSVLSLTFALSVSWHTNPYYYGADVVYLAAFTPFLIAGAGPFSLDEKLRRAGRGARRSRTKLVAAVALAGLAIAALAGGLGQPARKDFQRHHATGSPRS